MKPKRKPGRPIELDGAVNAHIKFNPRQLQQLDAYAERHDTSRSAVVRELVERFLASLGMV